MTQSQRARLIRPPPFANAKFKLRAQAALSPIAHSGKLVLRPLPKKQLSGCNPGFQPL